MLQRSKSILLFQLLVASRIQALGVLLPLYVDPGASCAAWSPAFDAVSAHSSTQFYIILNPNDGPGQTNKDYQSCVVAIPASTNQVKLGYVDTRKGSVVDDVDTYAAWDSTARPAGIFFDGVSPTSSLLSTYQSYVSHAKSKGFSFIALDPGETAGASYLSLADLVNTYEASYSSFNTASLSGTASKQSVMLLNAPSSDSYTTTISQLEKKGVAAVYLTSGSEISSETISNQLSELTREVAVRFLFHLIPNGGLNGSSRN
ncbi:Spherulation-specific family 4-domain-containing protein [Mycena crocata]|nr:Spherulation-specific family 4-domain-containing protein [Mycena crocata]